MPDTLATARELTRALDEHTEEVHQLRETVGRLDTRQWIMGAVTLVLLVVAVVEGLLYLSVRSAQADIEAAQADVKVAQQASCIRGNELRTGLLNIADLLEEMGSGEIEARRVVEESLRANFALRDCG